MKIDNNVLKSLTSGAIKEDTAPPARKSASDTPGSTTDSVQVSSLSAHLQAIEKSIADTPVVDAARVAEIKQAITSGHFKVDPNKVADRLLQTVQELLVANKA